MESENCNILSGFSQSQCWYLICLRAKRMFKTFYLKSLDKRRPWRNEDCLSCVSGNVLCDCCWMTYDWCLCCNIIVIMSRIKTSSSSVFPSISCKTLLLQLSNLNFTLLDQIKYEFLRSPCLYSIAFILSKYTTHGQKVLSFGPISFFCNVALAILCHEPVREQIHN